MEKHKKHEERHGRESGNTGNNGGHGAGGNYGRCGFVSLIGLPNAGKSTLLNQLVGRKVSIVTRKAQTTRGRVAGIVVSGDAQIVFHDVPGVFRGGGKFERAMVGTAWSTLADADCGLVLIDAAKGFHEAVRDMLTDLKIRRPAGMKLFLALNKVDLVPKEQLLPLASELENEIEFTKIFMISSLTGLGCPDLLEGLNEYMPVGPWLFDKDEMTDVPAKLLAAEFTREQIFEYLHQEIPYGAAVQTRHFSYRADGSALIEQIIFVQRDSHKGMLIGKGGRMLKRIGTHARRSMEELFDCRVRLELSVKVNDKWDRDSDIYALWGLKE